jgi:hypothetical protein
MANKIMDFFKYEHLPKGQLREVSKYICQLAHELDREIPDSAEKTAGLRKLLEAKDCLVRSCL